MIEALEDGVALEVAETASTRRYLRAEPPSIERCREEALEPLFRRQPPGLAHILGPALPLERAQLSHLWGAA